MSLRSLCHASVALFVLLPAVAQAELPAAVPGDQFPMRYVSLGDSLAAGFKAQPATKGFAYRLYMDEIFGSIPNTAFANLGMPGATSAVVLNYQVPQAKLLRPKVVTLSVGGNDLVTVLEQGAAPGEVLNAFAGNLATILKTLCDETMPEGGDIYLNNLYTIAQFDQIFPGANAVIAGFNDTIARVVSQVQPICNNEKSPISLHIADVFAEFKEQRGALLIDAYLRKGINFPDIHPTNRGYRLMEKAYLRVIDTEKYPPQRKKRHDDRGH